MKIALFSMMMVLAFAGCDAGEPVVGQDDTTPAAPQEAARSDAAAGSATEPAPESGAQEPGAVLAWVNDVPVYDAEIDFFLETRLNLLPFQRRDEELREKVLESLIASRAMAQVAEGELTDGGRKRLVMETDFFREEQLTKRYLETNVPRNTVSREMVKEYYDSHLEEFGQRNLKEIEWISTVKGLDADERQSLLPTFQSLDGASDWARAAAQANASGLRVEYKQGFFSSELLDPRLRALVDMTAVDSVSGLQMVDGRLHRIRVLDEKVQAAQSLGSVSAEIRKRLAPIAMRESVEKARDEVLAQVDVRFPTTANVE